MTNKLGCLVADMAGTELSAEDRDILTHPLIGGVILFARNYESPAQLKNLTRAIRSIKKSPLLIMVDQEGGRVQRFKEGFTHLPPAGMLGVTYDKDAEKGMTQAREYGHLMATEILEHGIDFSIAPVLDLNKPISKVIGDRAFHHTPQGVIDLATAYIQGMHDAGMPSVGKHFPGHGSVSVDSHTGIPVDNRAFNEVERTDLLPFTVLIQQGIKAILAAHVVYPQVDKMAAGFSKYWLNDILRTKLKFRGPILTDDLNMEGANISSSYADRVQLARSVGCDFTLVCNNRKGVIDVLDHLSAESNLVPYEKWYILKGEKR